MRIHDDGIGFDTQEADSGNGLMNMKKRAQSLKGKLQINSWINQGTTVTLEAAVN
jgi:signal transduction histidine kinase